MMRTQIFFLFLVICFGSVSVCAQKAPTVSLNEFVGKWTVDVEKSYSRSERKEVDHYKLEIKLSDIKLTIFLDSLVGGLRNFYHQDYFIDGRRRELEKTPIKPAAIAQTVTFNEKKISCQNDYGLDQRNTGKYLDHRTFSFDEDKRHLIVESVFISLDRLGHYDTETHKLYFLKQN